VPARKKDSELKLEVEGGEVGWKPAVPQMEMEGRARVRGERERRRGRRVVRCMGGDGVGFLERLMV
jgi:hypothetical protein